MRDAQINRVSNSENDYRRTPTAVGLVATTLFLLLTSFAQAQNSQFRFDPNGNLTVQMTGTLFPPQITGQPQNQVVAVNEPASFSVVVADARSMTFQWQFNGSNLSGKTGSSFSIDHVTTSDEGTYQVVLTNPSGSVTSAPALLWIDNDGDGLGDSWELAHFGNLTRNATSDTDGDGISNLREFLDGSDPTSPNSGRYRLLVIREGGSVIRTPDQLSYNKGQSVTLSATAASNELFHAWLGDVVSRDNPVTLVMTNDKTVYARYTPISFLWTNPASGNWENATNWSPSLVPGTNDIVLITSGVTVTLNSPADCAEVTLGSPSAAATLTGSGGLRIRDNFFWTGGVMTGTGRTILESNVILTLEGNVGLTTRTLENRGTIRWSGTSLGLGSGAVLTNAPGALFRVDGSNGFLGGAQARFDNAGLFRKTTGGGVLSVGSFFNNSGTVEIEAGALVLNNGGTNRGSFSVPTGTTLTFGDGPHAGTASSSITGAGNLTFNGAATFAGLVNVSGSNTFSSGTVNLTGDYICTNNVMTISGGTVHVTGNHFSSNNTLTVASGLVDFSGSGLVSPAVVNLISGTLDGSALVTIGSAMNWSGGTMGGSGRTIIPPGVMLNVAMLSSGGLNRRTLENGGTVLWNGAGGIGLTFGAVITNCAGALFQVQNAATISSGAGANRFDNAGTFRKSANSGTTILNNVFNNFGAVEIQSGTLLCNGFLTNNGTVNVTAGTTNQLAGGGGGSGAFTASDAALVEWTGSTFTLNPGAQLNGAGLYRINGISTAVMANGDMTVQNFDLINGSSTLTGAGVLTIANAMNWTAGTMEGGGRTLISPGATLQLGGAATGVSLKRTLENAGNIFWSGNGTVILLNGVITNRVGGLFQAENSAPFFFAGGGCRFDNAGTFRKSVSTGTTTIPGFVPFRNSGIVDLRSGILAANGGFVSSSNALLNCALGGISPGTNFGQLQVAGAVTLNGGLAVDLVNGFSPAVNDSFTVVSAGTRNGDFASFLYPSNAVSMRLSNTLNSVSVHVSGVSVPQPVLFTPMLSGSNMLLSWSTFSNQTYRLEFNPDLGLTNWLPLAGDVTALSNRASKLDPFTSSNRFYRVRILP